MPHATVRRLGIELAVPVKQSRLPSFIDRVTCGPSRRGCPWLGLWWTKRNTPTNADSYPQRLEHRVTCFRDQYQRVSRPLPELVMWVWREYANRSEGTASLASSHRVCVHSSSACYPAGSCGPWMESVFFITRTRRVSATMIQKDV